MIARNVLRLVLATLGLAACTKPRDVAALAGTYVMHQSLAADTLHLRADGRYVRAYRKAGAATMVDSGRWFLTNNKKMVGLRDYPRRWAFVHDLMGDPNGLALTRPATLALTVERGRFGRLRLGWHSEFGWWYERIKSGR